MRQCEGWHPWAAERRTRPLGKPSASELQLFVYEREILRMFVEGNLEEAINLFLAKDAMVSPPGTEFITGRDEQKEMFAAWLALEGVELDWEPIDAFVSPSGDMGYVWGLVRWRNPREERQLGKYISVWAKTDGRWLNKMEIRNAIRVEKLDRDKELSRTITALPLDPSGPSGAHPFGHCARSRGQKMSTNETRKRKGHSSVFVPTRRRAADPLFSDENVQTAEDRGERAVSIVHPRRARDLCAGTADRGRGIHRCFPVRQAGAAAPHRDGDRAR